MNLQQKRYSLLSSMENIKEEKILKINKVCSINLLIINVRQMSSKLKKWAFIIYFELVNLIDEDD